jgi:hypothetical protein
MKYHIGERVRTIDKKIGTIVDHYEHNSDWYAYVLIDGEGQEYKDRKIYFSWQLEILPDEFQRPEYDLIRKQLEYVWCEGYESAKPNYGYPQSAIVNHAMVEIIKILNKDGNNKNNS